MSLVPALDRRTLLIGGGIGTGLVVAFALWPGGLAGDLDTALGEQGFGHFIKIARSGRITVAVPQAETGQGVWTTLPQIVADELGAAWETIAVEPAPLTGA
ncbi:MAG: molybdopterin cofactor-binding domain-containing protein, partial [Sphingomicrobium sp.]